MVEVKSPNGGETFTIEPGQVSVPIRWESRDKGAVLRHDLTLSTDGGATFPTAIARNLSGTAQSFNWTVPFDLTTAQAKVRVIALNAAGNLGMDESGGTFTIQPTARPNIRFWTVDPPSNERVR
jgi:hypothetical protein